MSGRYQEPFPVLRAIRHPMFWGFWATVVVLAGFVWLGQYEECGITGSCETRADQFFASAPHEMGLAVGGLALVLIWVWLVVLVWVQSRMLRLMRRRAEARDDV